MAIAEIPTELTGEILESIGRLGLYIQAIGLLIIIWLIFQITNLIIGHKTKKRLKKIEKEIKQIKNILKRKK